MRGHLCWVEPFINQHGDSDVELKSLPDGGFIVDQSGVILDVGEFQTLQKNTPFIKVIDHKHQLILPGFIDCHLHMPQLHIIGSFGETLITWLKKYTFPAESKFSNPELAKEVSTSLINKLMSHGTTTASIFSSSHEDATNELFSVLHSRGIRAIAGKISMDLLAPDSLIQRPEEDIAAQKRLIEKWHQKSSRLHYALTPRFAPSCSKEMLEGLCEVRSKHPDIYVQSHLGETNEEIDMALKLHSDAEDYFDIYNRYGLTGPKSLFAHAIHLTHRERKAISNSHSSIVHCPSSNLFLGSGLCRVHEFIRGGYKIGLGSDVGGGTHLSLYRNLSDAYKISALLGQPLKPTLLLYLATVGGALCLDMEEKLGQFKKGFIADFQILSFHENSLLQKRYNQHKYEIDEFLLPLIMLADDGVVESTYVQGKKVFQSEF